jgi:hypothetical protein
MPFHIERSGSKYIVKDNRGKVYGTHSSRQKAQAQIFAITQNEK